MPKCVGFVIHGTCAREVDVDIYIDPHVFGAWYATDRKFISAVVWWRCSQTFKWAPVQAFLMADRANDGSIRRSFRLSKFHSTYLVRGDKHVARDQVGFQNRIIAHFSLTCNKKFGRKKWYRSWYNQAKATLSHAWKYL